MSAEVDVLHAVFGPVQSVGQSSDAACLSKELEAVRTPMCLEVDVPHAVLTDRLLSLCGSSGVACWSKGLASGPAPKCVEVDVPHAVLTDRLLLLC